jgi:hypothetical protein
MEKGCEWEKCEEVIHDVHVHDGIHRIRSFALGEKDNEDEGGGFGKVYIFFVFDTRCGLRRSPVATSTMQHTDRIRA